MKKKQFSHEQVETKQRQAIQLAENPGDDDLADDISSESPEDYAEHRGIEIIEENPIIPRRRRFHRRRRTKEISDRAWRYLANHPSIRPHGHHCIFCGKIHGLMVGHLDGHEENFNPANLVPTCRSCNSYCAITLKDARLGRRCTVLVELR